MVVGLIASIWIYIVSGVGNYSTPTLFESGPNGVAMDDVITGIVGLGAAFVLVGLLLYARRAKTRDGTPLLKGPLFMSLIAAWIFIYARILESV